MDNVGLSQRQLAERAEIGAGAVSRLERGEGDPLLTTLVRLARGLDLTPSELLERAAP
jgi:transcriptional regulator with XRE-family HTH domain